MLTAKAVSRLAQRYVEPLPRVEAFTGLYAMGAVPRRGQVTLVAGLPGSCKSMFALHWVLEMGLDTIYFTPDSDSSTMLSRLVGNRTDQWTHIVEEEFQRREGWKYEGVYAHTNVFFSSFEKNPTISDIEHEINAYVELNDYYPEVIVVDNLMDVDHRVGENEYGDMREVLGEFRKIAHSTGVAFIVLHHMTESDPALYNKKKDDGREGDPTSYPLPARALTGKVSQRPEMVLSVARDEQTQAFRIAAVKNRTGPSSKSAAQYTTLTVVPGKSKFYKHESRLY